MYDTADTRICPLDFDFVTENGSSESHFMLKIRDMRRWIAGNELILKSAGVTDTVVDALSNSRICLRQVTVTSENHSVRRKITSCSKQVTYAVRWLAYS